MKKVWQDVCQLCRESLDEIGVWPEEKQIRVACAVAFALVIGLVAHFLPFTIEAFIAAMLAFGAYVLGGLIFMGVGAGTVAIYMIRRDSVESAREADSDEGEDGPR